MDSASANSSGMHPLNVYVAGLPSLYNDRSLRLLFEPYGTIVSAKMMCTSTRQPNRTKGTGFVLFEAEAAAQAAIQALNGTLLEGDPIQVRLAKVANHAPRHQAPPLQVPQQTQPQMVRPLGSNVVPPSAPANAPVYLGNPATNPALAQFHAQQQAQQQQQQQQPGVVKMVAPQMYPQPQQQPQGVPVQVQSAQPMLMMGMPQPTNQPQVIFVNQQPQPQPQVMMMLPPQQQQ